MKDAPLPRVSWRHRRAVRWAFDGAMILAVIAGVGAWQTRRHVSGEPLPAVALPTLEGPRARLISEGGLPTMVVLWAPWCTVCAVEMQNLRWVQWLVGARARVTTVAFGFEQISQVSAFALKHRLEAPVLLGNTALEQELKVDAFPTVYFVGADGRVKRSVVGYTTTLGLLWRLLL